MLVGFPTAFSELNTEPLDRVSWYLAGFAQDNWTVTPSLTLNLGVRWEMDTPMYDIHNRMNSFDPAEINPVSGTPGVVKFSGAGGYPSKPYNADWNNFGPRTGFAWKVLGSDATVVRGGFGICLLASVRCRSSQRGAVGIQHFSQLEHPGQRNYCAILSAQWRSPGARRAGAQRFFRRSKGRDESEYVRDFL